MKKHQLKKESETNEVFMTLENLKICAQNQEGYETLYLNDSLQLQYCNFVNIANLEQCVNTEIQNQSEHEGNEHHKNPKTRGVNTLFLNNNLISKIENLHPLVNTLVTLNLSHNRITQLEGVGSLVNLAVLDLSYNLLKEIKGEEIKQLTKLNRLNLASNLIGNAESIEGIITLKDSLETLDLSSNQSFNPEPEILSEFFAHMHHLKVLFMKETPFVRMTSAYRKRVILAMKSLVFLDERPVTEDERMLAEAWEKGGIKEENEARKLIKEKSELKNKKILQEIEERQEKINEKIEQVYQLNAKELITELRNLKSFTLTEDFELLGTEEETILKLKIEELERYLELFKQECALMDLDKELGINKDSLPKMLVEKRTEECIFVYNVEESQLEAIKQKYYPNEELPLKAVNYPAPTKELEWLEEYNEMLERVYQACKGNWEMITPAFNLDIHEFDESIGRKVRRFGEKEIRERFENMKKGEKGDGEHETGHYVNVGSITREMNELDCLD